MEKCTYINEVIFIFSLCFIYGNAQNGFPEDFEFGTATSSYQIEGAWDVGGKGWSMWDHLARTRPEAVRDQTNGDTAAMSYYYYKRDVEMLKELGVDNYRFSISWPRVMPYGRDYVNPDGVAYYNALIDELLANDITPYVTMYHWDLPQNLNELGGWLNEDIVDWFGDYARVLYENFGDRVKHWMTINEPHIHCYWGHAYAIHAPLINDPGYGYYECGRNILLANARAYHIYNNEFRASQGGVVGFVISIEWGIQSSDSEEDAQALQDFRAFHVDHYIHPILAENGNYPQIMIDRVAAASAAQGLSETRLRPFSEEEIEYMKGTMDFLGLNHYTSSYVYRNSSLNGIFPVPSVDDDNFVGTYKDPSWPYHGFTTEYGPGLYYLLLYLRDTYNNPPTYITENGCSSDVLGLNDDGRTGYFRNYMQSVADAVAEGANVKGYFAWSLMDNFEWAYGYIVRFGIYEVDMEDNNRTRTPRKSALVLKEIFRSRVIDLSYDPDPYAITEEEDSDNQSEDNNDQSEDNDDQGEDNEDQDVDDNGQDQEVVTDGVGSFYASGCVVSAIVLGSLLM